jgi:hypothetical protein
LLRGALQPLADDLVVALRKIPAAGLPDPDDGHPPPGLLLALRLGGRGEVGVGGDGHAQPLRLARGKPVDQVVEIVIVSGRCHIKSLRRWVACPPGTGPPGPCAGALCGFLKWGIGC